MSIPWKKAILNFCTIGTTERATMRTDFGIALYLYVKVVFLVQYKGVGQSGPLRDVIMF